MYQINYRSTINRDQTFNISIISTHPKNTNLSKCNSINLLLVPNKCTSSYLLDTEYEDNNRYPNNDINNREIAIRSDKNT